MSGGGGGGVFVTWEEQVICQERGNRVIHFYLKDALGNSVLAVVGTERSVRHMMYVAPDHFLQAYGSTQPINAFKWRARREVVDWLTCLVSRNQSHHAGIWSSLCSVNHTVYIILACITTYMKVVFTCTLFMECCLWTFILRIYIDSLLSGFLSQFNLTSKFLSLSYLLLFTLSCFKMNFSNRNSATVALTSSSILFAFCSVDAENFCIATPGIKP
ncbi:hypothetical protein D0Y65_040639 [Glycine soja]|uniref:Uncharacterized protein n=1 Tax=Glycine soja TaxID=3848 RepID=A0A445GSB5_GLYSO|nr:hypothetical protein D0Y65_040639 [Glycine soja]